MFSGCSADPEQAAKDLTDQLLDEASGYSVIVVNDMDHAVTFKGVSRDTESTTVQSKNYDLLMFSGAIDVSYSGGNTVTFQKGKGHTYVATNCNGYKYLSGSEDANNLQVVNLTGIDFTAGMLLVKENNTSAPIQGTLHRTCDISSENAFNRVTFTPSTEISVDGGLHFTTIRKIDSTFINLGDEMKYSLIAYNDGNLSFVPLVKLDLRQMNQQP